MKLALYVRVSTAEQNPDLQEREMRAAARGLRYDVEAVYSEVASGADTKRPVRANLMADAKARKFDAVMVWKLDRFGRSMIDLIEKIKELDRIGVRFLCPRQGIDTDKSSAEGRLFLHILAAFAEFERDMIRDRSLAGSRRYREDFAAGRVGTSVHSKSGQDKPPHGQRRIFKRDEALEFLKAGHTIRETAEKFSIGVGTAWRLQNGRA